MAITTTELTAYAASMSMPGYQLPWVTTEGIGYENEITLPLHTLLTNEDVEYVTAKYVECVKEETGR